MRAWQREPKTCRSHLPRAQAQIDILVVHEEALVKEPDLSRRAGADAPSGATDGSSPRMDVSRIARRRCPRLTRPSGEAQEVASSGQPSGEGAQGGAVGDRLVRHPDVPVITLTGSRETGVKVLEAAAERLKHVHLELGGKNAIIVMDDADIDLGSTSPALLPNGESEVFAHGEPDERGPARDVVSIEQPAQLDGDDQEHAQEHAEQDTPDDDDDRHQHQDQRVLDQTLAILFGEETADHR